MPGHFQPRGLSPSYLTAICHLHMTVAQKRNTSKVLFTPTNLSLPQAGSSGRGISSIHSAVYVRNSNNSHSFPSHFQPPNVANSTLKCHMNSSGSICHTTTAHSQRPFPSLTLFGILLTFLPKARLAFFQHVCQNDPWKTKI